MGKSDRKNGQGDSAFTSRLENEAPSDPSRETNSLVFDFNTEVAPSFPGVFHSHRQEKNRQDDGPPELSQQEGDFEIIRELGRGASGVVYLAKQLSLDRQVALKVTHNVGSEARTMASVDHPHIVKVFSETISHDETLRMICMQYVHGKTMDCVIRDWQTDVANSNLRNLRARPGSRKLLPEAHVKSVLEIAIPVADALSHAHRQGVLHRDIKPANILVDLDGQPYLSDFSLSIQSADRRIATKEVFGGTIAYMSPEHLDALSSKSFVDREKVDQRADLYSLGLVILEMLKLAGPDAPGSTGLSTDEYCRQMADLRRQPPPRFNREATDLANAWNWLLQKCLAPNAQLRFQNADQLAAALKGMQHYATAIASFSPESRATRWLRSRPLLGPFVLGTFANLLGVAVGIAYGLSAPRVFESLGSSLHGPLLIWCVFMVVMGLSINLAFHISRLLRWSPSLAGRAGPEFKEREERLRVCRFGKQVVNVDIATWAPNYVAFPLFAFLATGLFVWPLLLELVVGYSFLMLVAVCCTYFVSEFYAIRVYYPYLWSDTREIAAKATEELKGIRRRVGFFQWLMGGLPVTVVVALVLIGPEHFVGQGYFTFRIMAIVLIVAGFVGMLVTGAMRKSIERVIDEFSGSRSD